MGILTWLIRTIVTSVIRALVWIGILFGAMYIAWRMDCMGRIFGG